MYYKRLSVTVIFSLMLNHAALAQGEFDVTAGLQFGHDTDVTVDAIDLASTLGDQFYVGEFGLAYQKPIFDQQNIQFSYHLSDKYYFENSQFDLQTHLLSASYDIKIKDLTLAVTGRYVHSRLDTKSFLDVRQISPALSWFINKHNYIRLAYTFTDKSLDERPQRDATNHEISSDYYYFINGLNSYVVLAVKLRTEDAQDPLFNNDALQFRIGYQKRLLVANNPLKILVDWRVRRKDYNSQIHPVIGDKRLDLRQSTRLKLEWEYATNWVWQWRVEYLENDSNLLSVDYSQWLTQIGAQYQF